MLSKELLAQVQALDDDDKLTLLRTLLHDPALEQFAFDPLGLRTDYQLAEVMMEELEKINASEKKEYAK